MRTDRLTEPRWACWRFRDLNRENTEREVWPSSRIRSAEGGQGRGPSRHRNWYAKPQSLEGRSISRAGFGIEGCQGADHSSLELVRKAAKPRRSIDQEQGSGSRVMRARSRICSVAPESFRSIPSRLCGFAYKIRVRPRLANPSGRSCQGARSIRHPNWYAKPQSLEGRSISRAVFGIEAVPDNLQDVRMRAMRQRLS